MSSMAIFAGKQCPIISATSDLFLRFIIFSNTWFFWKVIVNFGYMSKKLQSPLPHYVDYILIFAVYFYICAKPIVLGFWLPKTQYFSHYFPSCTNYFIDARFFCFRLFFLFASACPLSALPLNFKCFFSIQYFRFYNFSKFFYFFIPW